MDFLLTVQLHYAINRELILTCCDEFAQDFSQVDAAHLFHQREIHLKNELAFCLASAISAGLLPEASADTLYPLKLY